MSLRSAFGLAAAALLGCGTDGGSAFPDGGRDGAPDATFVDSSDPFGDAKFEGGGGGDGNCGPNLTGVLRDFHDTHPDFEKFLGDDRNMVLPQLGVDEKPVYASSGTTPTTTGKANFDQWYRDVANVNVKKLLTLTMVQGQNGISTYDAPAFFPLDGDGFGAEGREHNFHFTFELHTTFQYVGGEVFTFTGDDDLWTFINGKLAIDLGGVHGAETASVDLDADAQKLGLVKGQTYPLVVFSAERHTSESHFRIDTTVQFNNCDPIIR